MRRHRRPEGGVPARGERCARAGLLDADSPVQYNAFDLDLQLWVAACIYKGGVDFYRMFIGEMDDEDADRHYREGMALATTLQVPPEMWPADRAGVRPLLAGVAGQGPHRRRRPRATCIRSRWAGCGAAAAATCCAGSRRSLGLLITTGFLPQRFRDEMRLPWDAARQRRFDRLMAVLRTVNNADAAVRPAVPVQRLLWDLDRRIKAGRPLV